MQKFLLCCEHQQKGIRLLGCDEIHPFSLSVHERRKERKTDKKRLDWMTGGNMVVIARVDKQLHPGRRPHPLVPKSLS